MALANAPILFRGTTYSTISGVSVRQHFLRQPNPYVVAQLEPKTHSSLAGCPATTPSAAAR
jgi:hypothetical protein